MYNWKQLPGSSVGDPFRPLANSFLLFVATWLFWYSRRYWLVFKGSIESRTGSTGLVNKLFNHFLCYCFILIAIVGFSCLDSGIWSNIRCQKWFKVLFHSYCLYINRASLNIIPVLSLQMPIEHCSPTPSHPFLLNLTWPKVIN